MFEKQDKPGGLMRTNIPSFRLPENVLDEEVARHPEHGRRYPLQLAGLTACSAAAGCRAFDAVFVGTGAPRGKDLDMPGRHESDRIHIGIDWLESVAFGHIDSIGEKVLIIGVGNTAMDCCRSSRRLGGKDIKVMARRPRGYFKASPWELEDAEEEGIDIVINHAPKRFVIENGKLTGMEFERLEWDADAKKSQMIDTVFLPADDVILAIGQENAFPWIERDLGIEFDKWDMPVVDETHIPIHAARRLFRRRCGVGTEEHHLGRRARARGRDLHPQLLPGHPGHESAPAAHEPDQPEDGHQRVELSQRLQSGPAAEDAARRPGAPLRAAERRSRAGILPPSRPRAKCSAV